MLKLNKRITKHFNTNLKKGFSFESVSFLNPVAFQESKINKNAIIIENEHCHSKIIFPDYKFDLKLNIESKDYTIKQLLEDSKAKYSKENILHLSLLDEEGLPIAESTQASLLLRLHFFRISINWGDRIYNCINPHFMGNKTLEKDVILKEKIDFEKVEKLIFKDKLSFSTAIKLTEENKVGERVLYSSILKNYLYSKYSVLNEFYHSIQEKRERRIQKFINCFFYLTLAQVTTLNLCTFVFFSWDFMEPITTCITYMNIIFGYYYWALTKNDYEMESMVYWIKEKKPLFKSAEIDSMLREKAEIKNLLEEDVVKH